MERRDLYRLPPRTLGRKVGAIVRAGKDDELIDTLFDIALSARAEYTLAEALAIEDELAADGRTLLQYVEATDA